MELDAERAMAPDGTDAAEPGITRSSTGEDFEASAGPYGRDGCGHAHRLPCDTLHWDAVALLLRRGALTLIIFRQVRGCSGHEARGR